MNINIHTESVIEFLRDRMEPVSFDNMVTQFAGRRASKKVVDDVRDNLNKVLQTVVETGEVLHCNNHFYPATHANDMEGMYEGMTDTEMSSEHDESTISFSSAESDQSKNELGASSAASKTTTDAQNKSKK